jgi:hypothetical protein
VGMPRIRWCIASACAASVLTLAKRTFRRRRCRRFARRVCAGSSPADTVA